ncbi:MAG: hypothetical protein H6557_01685 [Lewinellaceae bacterium]|nr:hypothetical protein [Phaeodactylibacter sp.]MCB9035309.1 hypothetical protein [Lewinellaceae bacterium]
MNTKKKVVPVNNIKEFLIGKRLHCLSIKEQKKITGGNVVAPRTATFIGSEDVIDG